MARNRTSDIIDDLLITVALGGAVAMTVIAPNALIAIEKPLFKFLSGRDKRREARRIRRYIKRQKLIEVFEDKDGNYSLKLTDRGKSRMVRARFDRLTIPNQTWDKKWRIVMFDIPEPKKTERDFISLHLRLIGFRQLQKSVFIFPYSIDEFIALLNEIHPEIHMHVLSMTVNDISNHNDLVNDFSRILR